MGGEVTNIQPMSQYSQQNKIKPSLSGVIGVSNSIENPTAHIFTKISTSLTYTFTCSISISIGLPCELIWRSTQCHPIVSLSSLSPTPPCVRMKEECVIRYGEKIIVFIIVNFFPWPWSSPLSKVSFFPFFPNTETWRRRKIKITLPVFMIKVEMILVRLLWTDINSVITMDCVHNSSYVVCADVHF